MIQFCITMQLAKALRSMGCRGLGLRTGAVRRTDQEASNECTSLSLCSPSTDSAPADIICSRLDSVAPLRKVSQEAVPSDASEPAAPQRACSATSAFFRTVAVLSRSLKSSRVEDVINCRVCFTFLEMSYQMIRECAAYWHHYNTQCIKKTLQAMSCNMGIFIVSPSIL